MPAAQPTTSEPDLLDSTDAGPAALRGGVLRTAAFVAGLLLTLASAPLLVRHLGQERFGQYSSVLAIVAITTALTEGGLNAIALRTYATTAGAARDRIMANVVAIRLVSGVVAIGAAVLVSVVAGYPRELVLGTAVAGVGILLAVTQSLLSVGLQGELRFGWVSAIEFGRQVITVALIVAGVALGADVVGFLAISIPAGLAALAGTAVLTRRLVPLLPAFDVATWWPFLRDSIPYAIAIALNSLYFRITIVLMSVMATELQTGYFATSFRIVEVLITVPALVIGAAFPILARAVRDDMDRFVAGTGRVLELGVIVGAWMVLCLELGAGFAIEVIGGDEAEPAAAVLRIQAVAVLATFVAVGCGYPLLALHRHRDLMVANAVALAAVVVLTLVLVPAYDAQGAAAAAVVAELALAGATLALLRRASPGVEVPVRTGLTILLVAGACGLLALALPVHPILQVLVATLLYAGGLKVTGRLPPELAEVLATRRRRATTI